MVFTLAEPVQVEAVADGLVLIEKLTEPEAPAGSSATRVKGSENCGMGFGATALAVRVMLPLAWAIIRVPARGSL